MPRLEHTSKGATLIVLASVFFAMAGSLVKLGSYIGAYRLAFFRFAIGLGLIVSAMLLGRVKLVFNDKKLLFLRGLTGGITIFIMLLAITRLGLGKGMVLLSSYPIFASIISAVFLKERLRLVDVAAILTTLMGIFFIAYENQRSFSLLVFGKYEILAVLGAASGGVALTLIRKLHDTDDSLAIYFAQCAVGLWLMIVPAFASGNGQTIGLKGLFILLGMGACVTVGQLLMTEGFKYVPVKTGSLLTLLDPVLCCIAGVAIFGEKLTWPRALGSALVISSCAVVLTGRKLGAQK